MSSLPPRGVTFGLNDANTCWKYGSVETYWIAAPSVSFWHPDTSLCKHPTLECYFYPCAKCNWNRTHPTRPRPVRGRPSDMATSSCYCPWKPRPSGAASSFLDNCDNKKGLTVYCRLAIIDTSEWTSWLIQHKLPKNFPNMWTFLKNLRVFIFKYVQSYWQVN